MNFIMYLVHNLTGIHKWTDSYFDISVYHTKIHFGVIFTMKLKLMRPFSKTKLVKRSVL